MAQRVLAAIVITDAVGFSARAGTDEESALRELQADFAVIRAATELRNGVVLKSTGDGLLLKFDSAWDAVDASMDIQTQFASRSDDKFKHRMGVHLCDVVLDHNDAHGDGVNLAARLQEQAAPGGIILSKTILEIVKSRLSIQPISLGKVQLKNIPDRTEIYEISPGNGPKQRKFFSPAGGRGRNVGPTIGLAFVGVSILIATVVFALKKPAVNTVPKEIIREVPVVYRDRYLPAPATNPSSKQPDSGINLRSEPKVDLRPDARAQSTQPPLPPATTGPKVTAPPKEKLTEKKLDEDLPMTGANVEPGFSPRNSRGAAPMVGSILPAVGEITNLKRRFATKYDFESYAQGVKNSSLVKKIPNFEELSKHVTKLQELRTVVDAGLASSSPGSPIKLSIPSGAQAGEFEIWATSPGRVIVHKMNGEINQLSLSDLSPIQFRFLADAIARKSMKPKEVHALMVPFDQEFRNQLRGIGLPKKPKTGVTEDNPFLKGESLSESPDDISEGIH